MSLYNMVLGFDPMAPVLLTMLRLDARQVPRFRDCWWTGKHIVLLTRTGGGNRVEYESANEELRKLPTFVRDQDNEFDSTFAEFYYKVPDNLQWVVPQLVVQTKSMRERFYEALDKFNDPAKANDPQITAFSKELIGRIALFFNKE